MRSTHIDEPYAVCPSVSTVSSTAFGVRVATASAFEYGVAGSPVLPTTRMGGTVDGMTGTGSATAGAAHVAHGSISFATAAPNRGAASAARRANSR